jgi:NADH-dependent peroxiredoxin subunit F
MYDFLIIGGGPAGVAAGVYAARKKLNTILIAEEWGGQSVVSADIQNWIGTKNISGVEFAKSLEEHIRAQEGVEIIVPDKVTEVKSIGQGDSIAFSVRTERGNEYETRAVFIGSGARRRKLGIPGEKEFDGKGVALKPRLIWGRMPRAYGFWNIPIC